MSAFYFNPSTLQKSQSTQSLGFLSLLCTGLLRLYCQTWCFEMRGSRPYLEGHALPAPMRVPSFALSMAYRIGKLVLC